MQAVLLDVLSRSGLEEGEVREAGSRLLRHALQASSESPGALATTLLLARAPQLAFACATLARLIQASRAGASGWSC